MCFVASFDRFVYPVARSINAAERQTLLTVFGG
jgi:hypothetical protein